MPELIYTLPTPTGTPLSTPRQGISGVSDNHITTFGSAPQMTRADIISLWMERIVAAMDTALAPSVTDDEFKMIINGAESFAQCATTIAEHGRERVKKLLKSRKFQVKLVSAGARSFSERDSKLYIGLDIPVELFEYQMEMEMRKRSADSDEVKSESARWDEIKLWIEYHDVAPKSRPPSRQGSKIL